MTDHAHRRLALPYAVAVQVTPGATANRGESFGVQSPNNGELAPESRYRMDSTRLSGERGFTLIEILVGLGILGAISVAFMAGLGSIFRAQDINREQVAAQNLVRAQLEDIRNQAYLDSYSVGVPLLSGYSIAIDTQPFCAPEPCTSDNNVQENSVTVSRNGSAVVTVTDLKTRR